MSQIAATSKQRRNIRFEQRGYPLKMTGFTLPCAATEQLPPLRIVPFLGGSTAADLEILRVKRTLDRLGTAFIRRRQTCLLKEHSAGIEAPEKIERVAEWAIPMPAREGAALRQPGIAAGKPGGGLGFSLPESLWRASDYIGKVVEQN